MAVRSCRFWGARVSPATPAVPFRPERIATARRSETCRITGMVAIEGGRRPLELALFDLDNTLLSGDSDYEWAQFLVERGVLERAQYETKNDRFFLQHKEGRLDIDEFLEFQLAPLARHSREELDEWHGEFMRTRIGPMIRAKGIDLVQRHSRHGDLCAIVTSTNAFITAPIARAFGVEHLLATELEVENGRFTGKPSGTPCFRQGKVSCLAKWLSERGQTLASFRRAGSTGTRTTTCPCSSPG